MPKLISVIRRYTIYKLLGGPMAAKHLARSMQRENIYEIKRFEKNSARQEHFA